MRAKLSTGALLFALISPLQAATMPAQGLSMQAVEQQFGAPIKKNAAIGHPPITRWEYNGYVVVFERSTVIQSVEVAGTAAAPATVAKPAPAPVAKPVVAPAPAVAAPPAAAPAAPAPASVAPAPVAAPVVDSAEAQRQARESEAMARARAEREAATKAAATPAPAPVADAVPATPAAETPAPAAAAPAAPVEEPKKPKGDGSYTFDPATGRIIIN